MPGMPQGSKVSVSRRSALEVQVANAREPGDEAALLFLFLEECLLSRRLQLAILCRSSLRTCGGCQSASFTVHFTHPTPQPA